MTSIPEKEYLDAVAQLGCIICRNVLGIYDSPAVIHHIRTGQGASQRASNYFTIPLCPLHHTNGGYGVAIHAGKKAFEMLYGTELNLLAQTIQEVFLDARR